MREQNGLTMGEPKSRFGNYELVRRIDVGGMGEVYLAHQLSAFGRPVAIKIIRSDLVHDTTARARFLREAEVSAHLKHEHILPLFDFGEVDGRLFLVTPYIEGGTLATRLQQSGPMSLAEVHTLFVPLVQAVAYIHRRGVIHRDLKPTNVMLDMEDGEIYVRLIDFGIASLQGHSASPPLTTAGHEIGTIAYMAPERLSGIAAPSNDIFSLGVILHQMLTGRMPTLAPPPPNSTVPKLPEPLAQVVRRAVASNPAERYATAEELLKAFEQAYQQMTNTANAEMAVPAPINASQTADRHAASGQLAPSSRPELITLAYSGEVSALAQHGSLKPPYVPAFSPEDYSAPTTSFQAPSQYTVPPTNRPPLIKPRPPKPPKAPKKRGSPFVLLPVAIALVLLVMAAVLYYGYQVANAASVTVTFTPRARAISQVITLKADPTASGVDLNTATIPAKISTTTKSGQETGDTTGQVNCTFFFGCKQGVDQQDVVTLVNQIEPGLEASITQTLQSEVKAAQGVEIGSVTFSDPAINSDPQIGQPGQTVTVTVQVQGSVGYFLKTDETNVVQHALAASVTQLGPGYQLVASTISIGQPAVQAIDPVSGLSTIAVPAGVDALYQFTPAQLQAISSAMVGKSVDAAEAFLKSQPGIDPASITIRFTSGSGQTMPGDVGHIKLTQVSPGALPGVSLTPVKGITPTSTDNGDGN